VRVAAEEWQAIAPEELAAGTPIRVTKLDGLVLTVERAGEHAPAVPPASERS
jgi:membrane-bound ClpP family serine protease